MPTAKESGYDIAVGTWRGLGVPSATPVEIVSHLETVFVNAAKSDGFKQFMKNTNNDIELLSAAQFKEKLAADNVLFKKLIGSIGLAK